MTKTESSGISARAVAGAGEEAARAPLRILVLCTGNSARSQMAEGLLKSLDSRLEVYSAGTEPAPRVNPHAVRAMQERGIDISAQSPKSVELFLSQPFDHVITVCDEADRLCPEFHGKVGKRVHISFPDPARAEGGDEEKMAAFRRVRDDLEKRIREYLAKEIKE
jgi:arsenate reductase